MSTARAFTAVLLALTCVVVTKAQCEGSVTYRVSNVCNWTSRTHPTDYPSNAQFSPMCGTVHNSDYDMFMRGGFATAGVQDVAEAGSCDLLEGEIDVCVMEGGCVPGAFFSWMCDTSNNEEGVSDGVCTHSGMVEVSPEYPYVSLISMIAPSPDWFVGKSSVSLCHQDENTGEYYWVDQYPAEGSANLYAYDAGTDSGETFLSENDPTIPPEPITVFDAMDASNIFYNQEAGVLNPMCRILFEKA